MRNIITYALDIETGLVVSRMGSQLACPVLQYATMTPDVSYKTNYQLEKISIFALSRFWDNYKWTKKISLAIKNKHRKFWGMKELKK